MDAKSTTTLVPAMTIAALAPFANAQGFRITDEESDLELAVYGVLQFRYQASIRPDREDNPDVGDDDEIETGFDFRRARVGIAGNAVDERVAFEFEIEAADGDVELLDAWVGFKPYEDVTFKAGQFRIEFDRERSVSATKPLTADRSTLSNTINPVSGLRVQGVEAEIETAWYRVAAQVHDGSDSFNSGFGDDNALIAGNIRAEWAVLSGPGYDQRLAQGEAVSTIDQFSDFTAPPGTPLGIMIGVGGYAERREDDTASDGASRFAYTADINLEYDGLTASVIGIGRVAEDLNTGTDPEPEQIHGVIAQAGYYVTPVIEPFARHEYAVTSDDERENFASATVGFNYYIIGNALKFTLDGTWAYEGVAPFFERESDALLPTADGEEQFVVRAQLQLVF